MAVAVTGTFEEVDTNSDPITARLVNIDLTFDGTATVNLQWKVDGTNWRTIESYTASDQIVFEAARVPLRLNCSAYTNDVTYAMLAGD